MEPSSGALAPVFLDTLFEPVKNHVSVDELAAL
jgi:hypothetical protein